MKRCEETENAAPQAENGPDYEACAERQSPAFRRDGVYSLMVFLHAQAINRSGLGTGPADLHNAELAITEAAETLRGMAQYQAHPFRRFAADVPVAWRCGSVRLLDFGGTGPPVLAIPSLVNGAYIMDLSAELSPLRWLSRQGFRVFQIDWGAPGPEERAFGLGDYLKHRLVPALNVVARLTAKPVHLVGYCMGGPLMLALAQREAEKIGKIATLGAPWDFTAFPEHAAMRERRAEVVQLLDSMEMLFGVIPAQMTQSFFALRDMSSGVSKFRRFAGLDQHGAEARRFVAVEDWLNNGIPLAPRVGRECFLEWVTDDTPRKGKWAPNGVVFNAADVTQEALVVSAQRDTVVRRAASEPLATALGNARLLQAGVGHIGMVVGAPAIEAVWRPLADFLDE